jgi:amino acid transporter
LRHHNCHAWRRRLQEESTLAQQKSGEPRKMRTSVKGPLMFSAFWAVLAFIATLIFASGGTAKTSRFDLAFIAAGIAFIVILVVLAMLSMGHKPNADYLGKGSGVNLSSRKSGHGGHPSQSRAEADAPGAGTGDAPGDTPGGDLR